MAATQASLLLQKQLRDLCKKPVDGFSAGLVDESDVFEWSVSIMGPPDTLYEGGFFNAIMSFPKNYPNSPPTVRFTSEMWHPNVYPDGKVCISILHPPGDDPNGYELATERWSPVHTVESIVLSIISMLSGPNDESPANVDAANFNVVYEEYPIRILPDLYHDWNVLTVSLHISSHRVVRILWLPFKLSHEMLHCLKQWRDSREEFRKRVSRCVRKSQEML
ncbi:ubiquitin-conjugating enzyme E2 14 [Populus alba x Populus x berolinensis]|nr:ubiquitin-conjugating enzyme E2 14 [Populus alba x Populus x berolinensis]